MSYYPELEDLPLAELIERWNGIPINSEEHVLYYQEVAFLLYKTGMSGTTFLLRFLLDKNNQEDTDRLSSVLLFLPESVSSCVHQNLIDYLKDSRAAIVAATIDGFRFRADVTIKSQIIKLSQHEDPYVRSAVLRYISHLFPLEAPEILIQSLQDQHHVVRANAIDALDDLQYLPAKADITLLVNDPHPNVREAVITALENLADIEV